MSEPGLTRSLMNRIVALYAWNQALANLRDASNAPHASCSWLEEMHWLVETYSGRRVRSLRRPQQPMQNLSRRNGPIATRNGSLDSAASGDQPARDARHVLTLKTTHHQLEHARHAQFGPGAGHAAGSIGSTAGDLAHGGQILERVRQPDDDHAVM